MKKTLQHMTFLLFFLSGTLAAQAQWQNGLWTEEQAYNWCFGYHVRIDFNSGTPQVSSDTQIEVTEGSAVMSSKEGELLFYAGDHKIWNRNHQIMQNGDNLLSGGNSSTQSGVIVPKPGTAHIYYLFNVVAIGGTDGLRYSEIDMSLDNGLGAVTANKNILLNQDALTEKITAVHHANGEDIWVITHLMGSNEFVAYLVTDQGVSSTPVISATGITYPPYDPDPANQFLMFDYAAGQLKASPDGSRLANAHFGWVGGSKLEIFDFDNSTGTVSNPILIDGFSGTVYGIEFSPNSRYLYATDPTYLFFAFAGGRLYQFDVNAGNATAIENSKIIIEDFTGSASSFTAMQLAADGKIYINQLFGNPHVINYPNNTGTAVGFSLDGLVVPNFNNRTALPTFIQSYLASGILYEGACAGNEVTFSTLRIPGIESIDWDYGDGDSGTGITPTHIYDQAGTYTVTANITSNGAEQTAMTEITILEGAEAAQPQNLSLCDDGSGSALFDLSLQDEPILNEQDPTEYTVSYHGSENDAQNNINPLGGTASYVSSGETVYVRVTNSTTGCYAVTSFELVVLENPVVPTGLELTGCSPIDLTGIGAEIPEDFSVSYYEGEQDAQNEQNAISDIENYIFTGQETRLYLRVENAAGCSSIGELLLRQGDCTIPQGISPNGDGRNDFFDLTFLTASYNGGQLQIFNRYGRVVYEQPEYDKQWSGQDKNGNKLPTGTYYYVLELGQPHPEYGKVIQNWVYVQREVN